MASIGKPIPHDAAVGHVTGAAPYLDDLVPHVNELAVGFVGSPVASGRITAIEIEAALTLEGVVGCFTAEDIPGEKFFGANYHDEPILADGEVRYVGQPVVVIAAESHAALLQAKNAVEIKVAEEEPILSIDRAIELKTFLGEPRQIACGNAATAISSASHRLNGVFHSGGQEQFYLESQCAIAFPGEQGQMVVHSSTQGTTEVQHLVAATLGLGMHEVVCLCKRMGGAFGGKESQAAIPAIMAALVAHKTGRPARIVYNKDEDMQSTGKRHEYRTEWEVGFGDDGRILGLRVDFFSNGGSATDLSMAILERSLLHADNAYFLPHAELNGHVCFTNLPPNTAFRGFGGPQAMAATENILHEIAQHLGVDPLEVQKKNLYGHEDRNVTPYGQVVSKNHLPEIVDTLAERCDYHKRRDAITQSNQADRLWLRGIALAPVKFGISFTTKFMNQGNALVNVYTDGTVQVSTGATEMGQGVNTKLRQLVADEFEINWQQVVLMPTSTEKNANTPPTAASAGTDLNGAAAVNACQKIKRRLAAFASTLHGKRLPFPELCRLAHMERIDLGARGFYATPGIDFNRETGKGKPFLYFTQGAAVAEVKIDRFTGELSVKRVDLLIDIGQSINPGVDRGQVIGGFIQGMGWVTAECLVYNEKGALLSHSPTTYKIPAITDVPVVFNCEFFPNDDTLENVARSKAVGEPPLMHATCVWTAVKQALASTSPAAASNLRLPATGEEILRCLTNEFDR